MKLRTGHEPLVPASIPTLFPPDRHAGGGALRVPATRKLALDLLVRQVFEQL
ncbi:hypothetical protein [Sphingomonas oryzagri]